MWSFIPDYHYYQSYEIKIVFEKVEGTKAHSFSSEENFDNPALVNALEQVALKIIIARIEELVQK